MSIILSGDTHMDIDIHKLDNQNVKKAADGEFPSHVIVLGDFGLIWSTNPKDATEKYWTKWYNSKPWITLATLGNHENFERIYQLPLVDLYGGKAYKLSDKIYYLQHGHVFTIEGKTFFNFGGAVSIDKANRQDRLTWWREEEPTQADFCRGDENLKKVNYTVDYVLSHTAPKHVIDKIQSTIFGNFLIDDPYFVSKKNDFAVQCLSAYIEKGLRCQKHFFGHFHHDQIIPMGNQTYYACYERLIKI